MILSSNNLLETELSFIFGGTLATNKVFPLIITLFATGCAILLLVSWECLVDSAIFRVVYEYINQK